jgi:hypothetical protein
MTAARIGRRGGLALAVAAMLPAGCAVVGPRGAPVAVATSDGAVRYEGARARGFGADNVTLTASGGGECGGDLHPTTETATGLPAAFGGIVCEDGKSGILLFSGPRAASGGAVSGVMDRRSVSGRWGGGGGGGAGM